MGRLRPTRILGLAFYAFAGICLSNAFAVRADLNWLAITLLDWRWLAAAPVAFAIGYFIRV